MYVEELFTIQEKRLSSVEIVVEKIKALLIEEKLKPGDMIPSETVLADNLKVGRGSVREAVKILSAYGVLEIRRGAGTFVATASNKRLFDAHLFQILVQQRDYQSLTQVRELLEEGIVKLVIESASDADLQLLDDQMHKFLTELSKKPADHERANELDIQYHRLLGKLSHNPIVDRIYSFVIELFTPTINPIHSGVYEAHSNLHQAIMNRDPDQAVSCVRDHTNTWVESHRDAFGS
jgi:DNA-binding FadR family transcriptional regulator